jgi:hypothetical protein
MAGRVAPGPISQVLGRFRDEGLVVVQPRLIRILYRAGLQAYLDR